MRSEPQFGGELRQVGGHVDIVERIGEANRKSEGAGAREQRFKRIRCSQAIAGEKAGMRGRCADEIIAAVVSRTDDDVAGGKCFECVSEYGRRQVRAVAVERNDAVRACRREMRKHRREPRRESVTRLRDDVNFVARGAGKIFNIRSAGHMMDTLTSSSDFANAIVSSKRQRYKSITAGRGKFCAKRVFTKPGRGALAMTTSVQSLLVEDAVIAALIDTP